MLNGKIRYYKIIQNNPELLDSNKSVLEVGGEGSGLAPYLDRKIICLDQKFPDMIHQNIIPVLGSIDDINYDDASFDYVVCVDVMEHLAKEIRKSAIRELIRVAKEKVVLSFPCREFAEKGERQLATMYSRLRIDNPDWLQEHLERGLPTLADVISDIASEGYAFSIVPNEGFFQHFAGILLDQFFPAAHEELLKLELKAPLESPLNDSEWDVYYSFMITIYKEKLIFPIISKNFSSSLIETANIYCVYHKKLPTDHLYNVIPIYVGEAAQEVSPSALTDVLLAGRSLDNARWSELSAIYKIWKEGPRSDVVGFCHYRRLFQSDGFAREISIKRSNIDQYKIDVEMFSDMADGFVVIPQKKSMSLSIFSQYCVAHNASHICLMYETIRKMNPELMPYVVEQFSDKFLYANNMFITTWHNFDDLCSLWFSILGVLETEISKNSVSRYQRRDLSFLAERLFDLWIRKKMAEGVSIIETGIYFVEFENLDVGEWSPTR